MNEKIDKDSWATPQWLFNWLNSIYDFDIDLCADSSNRKCRRYFDEETDSLSRTWRHENDYAGFCNPPYSKIKPWIKKAINEAEKGFTTIMLIPCPNGESYYSDVFKHARSMVFINGRIAFYNPIFKKTIGGNTRGSCVIEFSKNPMRAPTNILSVDRDTFIQMYSTEGKA